MRTQQEFLRGLAERHSVRTRVSAFVIVNEALLVQRPGDEPDSCYAFIGGEYEAGDTFDSRIRQEFVEETTARVLETEYLFVVENRFWFEGNLIHSLEHFLQVRIDAGHVHPREDHLTFHWLPLHSLSSYDLRPAVARDAIAAGRHTSVRHLIQPFEIKDPAV